MIDKKKAVFFDIDTQFDFIAPKGALYVPESKEIVKNLKRLVECARKNKIVIVATADAHTPNDPEFKTFPPHCIKGTRGQQKIEATKQKAPFVLEVGYTGKIPANKSEYLIEKQSYSFFSNPRADELLSKLKTKRDTAVVFGVATDYCVKSAVEGLLERNWKVFLVEDAIKEISESEAKKLFEDWQARGVKLIKSKDIIASLC